MKQEFLRYQLNRVIKSEYYESFDRYIPTHELMAVIHPMLPSEWVTRQSNVWCYVTPFGYKQPRQGWKIHISSIPQHCCEVLQVVADMLFAEGIPFKFLRDTRLARLSGGKMWRREAGGKFITIYPKNEDIFTSIIEQLRQALQLYKGPYILTDRRYKDSSTVYYRYGGFDGFSLLTPMGDRRHYLVSPEGDYHPDMRMPYFTPPPWVDDPFPDNEDSSDSPYLKDGRYRIDSALSFSMHGGVYIATDMTTNQEVIVKEARPYTQVDEQGHDAVYRLRKEYDILRLLSEAKVAPQPLDLFQDWEHTFLVEEFIAGIPLNRFFVTHTPLMYGDPSDEMKHHYLCNLKKIWMSLALCVAKCHDHNLVCCDLSITNVILRDVEEGCVTLIDMESGFRNGTDRYSSIFTPGYSTRDVNQAPRFEDDIYSLGAIMLALLLPVNSIYELDPSKKDTFLEAFAMDLGMPTGMQHLIRSCIHPDPSTRPTAQNIVECLENLQIEIVPEQPLVRITEEQLLDTIDGMVRYVMHNADYYRTDRLFPGDPILFQLNPLSIAHGAAGVAHSLRIITGEVPKPVLSWMLARTMSIEHIPPGLFTGTSGIAWVLLDAGLREPAERLMHNIQEHPMLWQSANLFTGASGYGMACLHFYHATKDDHWLQQAIRVGDYILASKQDAQEGSYWLDAEGEAWYGLANGSSGVALYLLYLSIATNDSSYLKAGEQALAFELGHLGEIEEGHLSVPRGKVDAPDHVLSHYWQDGSAGVASVLVRYWAHTAKSPYYHVLTRLAKDTCKKYTNFPCLFKGLSGLGNLLIDMYQFTNDEYYLEAAHRAASGVMLYRLERPNGITFPGEQLMKVSTDYATGSAGVALFLHRLAHSEQKLSNFNFTLDYLLEPDSKTHLCKDSSVMV
ncbi:class III lanthionine synthetase LanKC [Paenibacillus sp. UMB4589-SE434]|uniref:class III lanthionine synthetase LanKC n=1 Tax=Paenibacillus sp. UMB4589-SE434 TaxID=3046314 RepID=UPI00254D3600|nr:class III lanthionine synthetase LanKC [Paenibacillus sp. UMB4589-SE434]MDK8180403.1 class III lanthionine synthetase LanKC [Paenibacillus sp. UMB4589-SE434]